jgi:hypothetical protein
MESNYFNNYMANLNQAYVNKTNDYDFVFNETDGESYNFFFRAIGYLIDWFLENSDEKKFFIQVPVKELGKLNQADKNFKALTKVIVRILGIHGIDRISHLLHPDLENNQIIFVNDYIKVGNETHKRFFQFKEDQKILKEVNLPATKKPYLPCKLQLDEYQNKYSEYSMQVNCLQELLSGKRRNLVVNHLSRITDFINNSLNIRDNQFSKILIVGYALNDFDNYDVPVPILNKNDSILNSSLYYSSNSQNLPSNFDLIVAVGDKKYKYGNFLQEINNRLNSSSDSLKKVIYIGTEISQNDIMTYSFSMREISYYFRKNIFPIHFYKELEFEELVLIGTQLNKLLDEDSIFDQVFRNTFIASVLYPVLSINFGEEEFSKESSCEIIEDLLNKYYLSKNTPANIDLIIKISDWYQNLDITFENPKLQYLRNNLPSGKKILIPNNKGAYKKKIREIMICNKGNDQFIFDSLSTYNLEIYKYMLRNGIIGKYYFLCYSGFENQGIANHKEFMDREYKVYKSELRNELTKVQFELDAPVKDLEDYDGSLEGALNSLRSEKWNSTLSYHVSFNDNTNIQITGNIIFKNEELGIDEVFDYFGENEEQVTITYYENPADLFEKIAQAYRGFDIQGYVDLWKSRLRHTWSLDYKDDINLLFKDLSTFGFKTEMQLRDYIEENNQIRFSRDILSIVKFLISKNRLSETEGTRILQARRALTENQRIGGMLKDELYDFFLNNKTGPLLKKVTSNDELKIKNITSASLFTKTIRDIKIKE